MNKLKNKIMEMDFPKFFRRFVLIAVIAALLGGIATGIALRTQISEAISYEQISEVSEQEYADAWRESASDQDAEPAQSEHEKVLDDFEAVPFTEPTSGAKVTLLVFGLICFTAFCVYWLTVAAWLYQSAARSGFHGLLWFLLALCGNLFAVILFALVRSYLCIKCEGCGKWQNRKNRYCVFCGTSLYDTCPVCNTVFTAGTQYCSSCGKKLSDGQG